MSLSSRALKAMSGDDASLGGALWRGALSAAVPLYAAGNAVRSAGFALGIKGTGPLGRPAVCVGNLTTGGTGKTPMVGHLVRHLASQGHKPCILLRGYRGGDEAQEHQRSLGELAFVEPNPDRVAAAKLALGEHPEITCFVLDDGFQHRRARRDLDLVLIDATNPWGYGRLLPRGLMREPKGALRRADAVVVTRADQVSADALARLDREIQSVTGKPPIAHAEYGWAALRDASGRTLPLTTIQEACVMGVVGIGNPKSFSDTLAQHAGQVVHCEALPDHYGYTRLELLRLIDLAEAAGAGALVTTEKDWVKWSLLLEDERVDLPVYRAQLSVRFSDGQAALMGLVDERLPAPAA